MVESTWTIRNASTQQPGSKAYRGFTERVAERIDPPHKKSIFLKCVQDKDEQV